MKTEIYNLIILDESGSMRGVKKQTITGCNETINTIRSSQEEYKDSQTHYVSIFAFQDRGRRPSRYLIKNAPIEKVEYINDDLYQPWGNTPLYDAVGSTLVDLNAVVNQKKFAIGSITIITDGYENASRHYTREKVAKMIDSLKEIGWNFNFIGANIDVEEVSASLNIDNSLAYSQSDEGTKEMFSRHSSGKRRYYERISREMAYYNSLQSKEDELSLRKKLREAEKDFFSEEEGEKK
ncbi:MAG: hypothetical protein LUC37_00125 [Prevotella sp.]|nr:hypothetical protein [Prevotella sp.]